MEDLEDIEKNQKKCIVLLTKKVYKEMMKLQIENVQRVKEDD